MCRHRPQNNGVTKTVVAKNMDRLLPIKFKHGWTLNNFPATFSFDRLSQHQTQQRLLQPLAHVNFLKSELTSLCLSTEI